MRLNQRLVQCDSIHLARSVNEMNMNHGTFKHCEKLSTISLEETKWILSQIRETVTISVKEFTRFRRMPDSPSSHIYSCLPGYKKCSSCHVVTLKVEESPWDLGRWTTLWSPVSDQCLELSREIHTIWWTILTTAFTLEPRNYETPIWEMLRKIDNYFECTEISCFIILITWYTDIATCMCYSYSWLSRFCLE